jgi:transketolase
MTRNNIRLRRKIVEMVVSANEGHIPSSFSIIDIVEVLYRCVLQVSSEDPAAAERDFFVLSKGHGAAALYVVLKEHGFLHDSDIQRYGLVGGILGGHPDSTKVPGVEASTGSLGHGFPFSVGLAMGQKIKGNPGRVIALVGDGECQEGTIWESAHVAANRGLDNLCVVVDWNGSGAQLTPQDNLPAKWAAFGWDVVEIDGRDTVAIEKTFQDYRRRGRGVSPLAVVAHTVKGKGVSFIEGHGKWHHRVPDPIELAEIMKELAE